MAKAVLFFMLMCAVLTDICSDKEFEFNVLTSPDASNWNYQTGKGAHWSTFALHINPDDYSNISGSQVRLYRNFQSQQRKVGVKVNHRLAERLNAMAPVNGKQHDLYYNNMRTVLYEQTFTESEKSKHIDSAVDKRFLKLMEDDARNLRMIEAKIPGAVPHLYFCGRYKGGGAFMVMEYGSTMKLRPDSSKIDTAFGKLSKLARLFRLVGSLHALGFAHCDIKPDNVLMYSDANNNTYVKLIDLAGLKPKDEVCETYSEGYYAPEYKTIVETNGELGADIGENFDSTLTDAYSMGILGLAYLYNDEENIIKLAQMPEPEASAEKPVNKGRVLGKRLPKTRAELFKIYFEKNTSIEFKNIEALDIIWQNLGFVVLRKFANELVKMLAAKQKDRFSVAKVMPCLELTLDTIEIVSGKNLKTLLKIYLAYTKNPADFLTEAEIETRDEFKKNNTPLECRAYIYDYICKFIFDNDFHIEQPVSKSGRSGKGGFIALI